MTRNSHSSPILLNGLLILASLLLVACDQESLAPLQTGNPLKYVDVQADFCTLDPVPTMKKMKYLFILDHSQSNQPGFSKGSIVQGDVDSTDPTGARRYGPLVQFVKSLVPVENTLTSFALIDFSDSAYLPQGEIGFFSDSQEFLTKIVIPDWIGTGSKEAPTPQDVGFTNYQSALSRALTLISSDAASEALSSSTTSMTYQIIFVSDGMPTVPMNAGMYTQDFSNDIRPIITGILDLKNNPKFGKYISSITLNTAYYFQNTSLLAADNLLQQMAVAGNGRYMKYGSGQSIYYQQFVPPTVKPKYNLADIWVENQNVTVWDDGRIMKDSDGDGLPDLIELSLGSNPFSADSDGNGVSDLVEYRLKGKPCLDSNCIPSKRAHYSICDGFSPSRDSGGSVSFPSQTQGGLNDCERFILGATLYGFDSNNDFIPDLLALKNSIPFSSRINGAIMNPTGGSMNNYLKLKLGYPIKVQANQDFYGRSIELTRVSDSDVDKKCYHFVSKHVATLGNSDKIQVSIIENTSIIENKTILLTATRNHDGKSSVIQFNQSDFK